MRKPSVIVVLWIAAACGGQAVTKPKASEPAVPRAFSKVVTVGGPLPEPCRLGKTSDSIQELSLAELVQRPEAYYGQLVSVRGYFVLALENVSLLEPVRRKESILVGVRKLPAETEEQLLACRLKLVDVQGYITHVPNRGKGETMIFAQAMVEHNP